MIARLNVYWSFIRTSLWFIPVLMSAGAVALAASLLSWGNGLVGDVGDVWLIYSGNAENSRELLSSLLSGMITMTSLVVSITMVVLTLAAGQLGPRLIRNFMGDRQVQMVLGLFTADILYLIVVLRTVGDHPDAPVPHLAVTTGTALTALSLFVLLLFVDKLARSIIADNVVRGVSRDLDASIRRLLPDRRDRADGPAVLPGEGAWVGLGRSGYIQTVDYDRLVALAEKADIVLRVAVRPGHFVLAKGEHVAVHPGRACTGELRDAIRGAFSFGAERTPTQDLEYGIRQMVEVGLRALSPGINDTFTAIAVIDNLSASLSEVFLRMPEDPVCRDAAGKVRILRNVTEPEGFVAAAFDQIRQAGAALPAVAIRLVEAIDRLAPYVRSEGQRRPLLEQLDAIMAAGEEQITRERDITALRERYRRARDRLGGRSVMSVDDGVPLAAED